MNKLIKNILLTTLFIVIIVGGLMFALFYLTDDGDVTSIQGTVEEINQNSRSLTLLNTRLVEGGIEEIEYYMIWENDDDVFPHHPRVLRGGEIIKVSNIEWLDEDGRVFTSNTMEIIQGVPTGEDVENVE